MDNSDKAESKGGSTELDCSNSVTLTDCQFWTDQAGGESRSHICVCVCTFQRPAFLADLLRTLLHQTTDGKFTYSIVVVDNDCRESARETIELLRRDHANRIKYFVEPEQNIALARNKAVEQASGDYVAFIDDDEIPSDEWLLQMYSALIKYPVDGVLGPVKPRFKVIPPGWIVRAGLFERPSHKTGYVLDWTETRTGNALIRRCVLEEVEGPFNREFGSGGEDRDFFRRAIELGRVFVWCEEATAYEIVPAERTSVSFHLRRALLRGKASLAHPSCRALEILRSVAACGLYTLLLPVFLVLGRHVLIKYLIKDFDHIGKLLAVCGINVVREKYVLN